MSKIKDILLHNRKSRRGSLVIYLNCGDPSLNVTYQLIRLCADMGVDAIELGVPFSNSFTDGGAVLRSHKRALENQVTFEDTIEMVKTVRAECKIPIVLLADFSHTVKSRGIEYIVKQSSMAGIEGVLLHGLPPLYLDSYLQHTQHWGIDPIFSLYPNTPHEKVIQTLNNSKAFVYLVSQYGRTGSAVDFNSPEIREFYSSTRQATALPLMAGFGIKSPEDMRAIFSRNQIDGVIMGSAISNIIENALPSEEQIYSDTADYLTSIDSARNITVTKVAEREDYECAS